MSFDLLGQGKPRRRGRRKDGFLALDRNGNGTIDGAAELFGSATDGQEYEDGFALSRSSTRTTTDDRRAGSRVPPARVWVDANRDGVSQPSSS